MIATAGWFALVLALMARAWIEARLRAAFAHLPRAGGERR